MKPHKHAEVIKAWADGAEIEYEDCGWHNCTTGVIWDEETQYRVKPAAPKWPQTTMTYEQLETAYSGAGGINSWDSVAARELANAAIAHACGSGALVPADKVREIEAKAFAEGGKRNEDRDREVIWWALQRANVYPTSKFLDELVKKAPK